MKKFLKTFLVSLMVVLLLVPGYSFADDFSKITIRSTSTDGSFTEGVRYSIKSSTGSIMRFRLVGDGLFQYSEQGNYSHLNVLKENIEIIDLPAETYTITAMTDGTSFLPVISAQGIIIQDQGGEFNLDFSFKKSVGSIAISVVNESGAPVGNKSFALKDLSNNKLPFALSQGAYKLSDSGNSTLISNEQGIILLTEIPYGHYLIEQTGEQGTPYRQHISISSNATQNVVVSLKSTFYSGDIVIITQDLDRKPIKDVSYEVMNMNGVRMSFVGTVYSENGGLSALVTPENGVLELKALPAGEYTLKTISDGYGYDTHQFRINPSQKGTLEITLKKQSANILYAKKEKNGEKAVPGFKISVLNKLDGSAIKFNKTDQGYIYDVNGTESVLETNEAGIINILDIPTLDIQIKEIEAPQGYLISPDIVDKKLVFGQTTEIMEEARKPSIVLLTKSTILSDLIKDVSIEFIDERNQTLFSKKSDEKGEIRIDSLKDGKYKLQVVSVPEKYALPANPVEFEMKNGEIDGLSSFSIDETKIVAKTNGSSGSKFVLFKDGEKYEESETDQNGEAIFLKLPYGKYAIKQTSANVGEEISDKEYNITIQENYVNGETLSFFEEKVENKTEISATPQQNTQEGTTIKKNNTYVYLIVLLVIILLIIVVVQIMKNKKTEKSAIQPEYSNKEIKNKEKVQQNQTEGSILDMLDISSIEKEEKR